MIYELSYPRFTTIKVSIRIVSGTLRVRFNTRYLWIGLDYVSKNRPMPNSELSFKFRNAKRRRAVCPHICVRNQLETFNHD